MAQPNDEQDQELTQADINEMVRGTEDEILKEAFQEPSADEPTDEAGDEQEAAEEAADQTDAAAGGERARNEKGQFAKRDAAPSSGEQAQSDQKDPAGEGAEQGDDKGGDADVPRWRLREIAEERRAAQAERDQLRVELTRLQAQVAQVQQQPVQQTQQEQGIDPLLDPQGWQRQQDARMEKRLSDMALDHSLQLAHMKHGDVFEKAWSALVPTGQQDGGELIRQLTSNPRIAGERIVAWYRHNEVLRETKGDLNGFRTQLRSELLKDPEFRKEMIAAIRKEGNDQGQQPGRPSNLTRIPPSLARQPGNAHVVDPSDSDDSEGSVFDYAMK